MFLSQLIKFLAYDPACYNGPSKQTTDHVNLGDVCMHNAGGMIACCVSPEATAAKPASFGWSTSSSGKQSMVASPKKQKQACKASRHQLAAARVEHW